VAGLGSGWVRAWDRASLGLEINFCLQIPGFLTADEAPTWPDPDGDPPAKDHFVQS
jgi:hypothetical protein